MPLLWKTINPKIKKGAEAPFVLLLIHAKGIIVFSGEAFVPSFEHGSALFVFQCFRQFFDVVDFPAVYMRDNKTEIQAKNQVITLEKK